MVFIRSYGAENGSFYTKVQKVRNYYVFFMLILFFGLFMHVTDYELLDSKNVNEVNRSKSYSYTEPGDENYSPDEPEIRGWYRNTSRNTEDYVHPDKRTELTNSLSICDSQSGPLFLLIGVISAPKSAESRRLVRETWGNTSYFNYPWFKKFHGANEGQYLDANYEDWTEYVENPGNTDISKAIFKVKLFFILGKSKTEELQPLLDEEQRKYGDLVQEDFYEDYNNLTLKSIFLLKWIVTNCDQKVKYVMKVDDDSFVNVPNLIHYLLGGTIPIYLETQKILVNTSYHPINETNRLQDGENVIIGMLAHNTTVYKVKMHKWFVPNYIYSDTKYPEYVRGLGYIFSYDTAKRLYYKSLSTPIFHLEDVYITGLVAANANVQPINHPLITTYVYTGECRLRGIICEHSGSKYPKSIFNHVTNLTNDCPIVFKFN